MLTWLVESALRQRVLMLALALALVVVGMRTVANADIDVFPEFAPPLVEIQTEAPGLSTEEVESLITVPIETQVAGVPGLATLRSKSVMGLSSVVLVMKAGTDPILARQLVQERLSGVIARLPTAARPPFMLPPLSATSRAMKIGITSASLDRMQMSELVRWTLRPRLMAVPGVANVAMWGMRDRQLQVLVEPERLAATGVTLADVQRAAGDAVVLVGGGFVDTPNQRFAVRPMAVALTSEALGDAVVRSTVRLRDVATVQEGWAPPIGEAIINGKPGILLIVEKQQGANTLSVTRAVDQALAEVRPALKGLEIDDRIFRPATFIERAIDNLEEAMAIGCLLVAVVLILFTQDWRAALISLTAIPLSLLAAGILLDRFGIESNTMVIAGLVIALGEIVDDAIIDVENIGRRLRLEAERPNPRTAFAVVLSASLEVRSAVVFASAIVCLAFLPVFFLDGVAGSFFHPLGAAYVLAIAASLLVALTVTPALALLLLPRGGERRVEPKLAARLREAYARRLPALIEHPRLAIVLIAGGLAASVFGFISFKDAFLPDFRETDFLMHFVEKPGIGIDAMARVTTRASNELTAIPGVASFGSHIGRAEQGDEVYGANFTELWISLASDAAYEATVAQIETAIAGYPGLQRDVLTYLRERIKEVLTGAGATIVVRLYGPDLLTLRALAADVRGRVASVPGIRDLKFEQSSLIPQIQVIPRSDMLAVHGLTAGDVRRQTGVLIQGQRVGEVYRDQKSFEVTVWSEPGSRADIESLQNLVLDTPAGGKVRLGNIADIRVMPAANEVKREDSSRRIDVTMNLARDGGDLGAVAKEVERRVRAMSMPTGYYPRFLGEYQALQDSRQQLSLLAVICLAGILLLIWLDFRDLWLTGLVALSLPFALVGGIAAVALCGGSLSLGGLVGFVTVLGIAARNGIMLVSHYQQLEQVEGLVPGAGLALRGASERVVPILMTASCAALALLPLIARGNVPGHEIEHPMAIVILGGLLSSTFLNVALLPALYTWVVGRRT